MLCVRKKAFQDICLLFSSDPRELLDEWMKKNSLSKTNEQSPKEYPDKQFSLVSDAKITVSNGSKIL